MKKLAVLFFVVTMLVAFAMPAAALESVFGGYWRTRAYTQQNYDGEDQDETKDWTGVDTRTRLFWTAVINDNLKFVNRFEFDATWGVDAPDGTNGADGDFGTDGAGVEIKHSFAEFNIGPVTASVGLQPATLGRGFLFSDDFAGAIVTFKADKFTIPLIWLKPHEGGAGYNSMDADWYAISPTFKLDPVTINPYVVYAFSENGSKYPALQRKFTEAVANTFDEVSIIFAGLDLDFSFAGAKIWLTGIYEAGSIDFKEELNKDSLDIKAYLLAGGLSYDFGMADIHAQAFYATGEDTEDEDYTEFWVPSHYGTGPYYPWAQIMGEAIFDPGRLVTNTCGYKPMDILAINLGTKIKPAKDLTITIDGWYAQLAEDRKSPGKTPAEMTDKLGTEVDVVVTYQLVKNLALDVVGAYIFADDAIWGGENDANPYLIGSRLSLSF